MKKWVFTLVLLLLIGGSSGATDYNVQTTTWLKHFLVSIDSANGTPTVADSAIVHVITGDRPDSACYSARITSIPSAWIGRIVYPATAHPVYFFSDSTADCDCDSGAGVYSVLVRLWKDGTPFDNRFSFEITDSSFNEMLTRVGQMNYEVLKPTTATRKLDVTANGEAGIDLDNVNGTLSNAEIEDDVEVDMKSVSTDAGAADNLETMLDGTGGGDFDLGRLRIYAASNETAFVAVGAGSGFGAHIQAGATGLSGAKILATTAGSIGLNATGNNNGIYAAASSGTGTGLYCSGQDAFVAEGTEYGMLVKSTGGTGAGFSATGAGNADGMLITSAGTGDDIELSGDGRINGTIDSAVAVGVGDDGIDAPAFADNAQYMVYGGAVWVDTVNGTAGTVVGVNGLPSLPCRGFEKAKIIADAIGVTTFCLLGGGDQSIKETVNGYTFIGTGDPTRNQIDLNSQDVGGCTFVDLDITGIQGGDRAAYVRCALEDVSIDAAAIQCGLRGNITLLGDRDNIFVGCASSVPGGVTPSLIFSGGSESVQFRGYSGGIHLYGMGSNDTLSFEAIGGQLQVGSGVNVNAKITARGMITLTDSTAGLNNLTYEATAQFALDSTMNAITATNKANFKADVTNVTVGAFAADAIGAPAFHNDALFMVYGGGVWVDDGANTNVVPGVDGLPSNPVGTIAAAKTIADLIGTKTIYFVEGTNETIGATMEHYRFIGVTNFPDVTLSLNGQDVDFSLFQNVILTGIQGGTGLLCAIHCAFNNTDSLKVTATGCALLGDISVQSGTDSYFDQCYSGIAGNVTPTLTFGGSGSATENVNFRHYSGGLRLRTMTATDVISFESDGQLLIGADCHASATVTARGMMTLYDSAGVNLTYVATTQYAVDSTMNAITDVNKANFKATDLSVEIDSILATLYDRTNDTTFVQIISQYVLKHLYPDSVTIDNSNAWDLSGGTDLSSEVDSILATLYDRTNDSTFVQIISQYVLKHLYPDSVIIDNSAAWDLSGGGDVSAEVDSILAAIYDRANDTSFVKIISQYVLKHLHADSVTIDNSNAWDLRGASCAGTGSDTLDIMVFDGDSTAVEGVSITIYNLAKTAYLVRNIKTDANGYCQVFLDPGSYPCWVRRLGVILAEWDTVTVSSGGGRDTIWVVAQAQGSPPSGDLTQVKGYIRSMSGGQYGRGWISFAYHESNVMDTSSSPAVYVDPTPIKVQVDTGAFVVNLKPSSNLLSMVQDGTDKDSVTYDVTIWTQYNTIFRRFNIFIPDSSGAVWLEDLID